MSFVFLKFLHITFMFLGAALAIGPTALLVSLVRTADAASLGRTLALAERIFQVSTVCYGLGIVFGVAAALTGTLDLTAPWLLIAYGLVAVLGAHGTLFDRWTKQVAGRLARGDATAEHLSRDRAPTYYLSAMVVLA